MKILQEKVNLFQENSTIALKDGPECVLIDPAYYSEREKSAFLAKLEGLDPVAILITHGHADHIFAVKELQERYRIPAYMSEDDVPVLDFSIKMSTLIKMRVPDTGFEKTFVKDGDSIKAAGFEFKCIATPGHTPGGICYYEESEKVVFSGDTLFAGTIGRTDFEHGDYDAIMSSLLDKLLLLPGDTEVIPGHGGSTTIAREIETNPFLEPFNEKEPEDSDNLEPIVINGGR